MNKLLEYKGIWWLPENQERKIAGTLRFIPEVGPILELIGSFWDLPDLHKVAGPEIILGTSDNGKKITLFKYNGRKDEISWPGLQVTTIKMKVVFIGYHFIKREDLVFDSISINYSYLNEWYAENPFSVEWNLPKSYKLLYKCHEPVIIELEEFKISLEPEFSAAYRKVNNFNIKYLIYLKIEGNKKHYFEDLIIFIEKLRDFISLGVKRPIYPNIIKVRTDKNVRLMQDGTEINPLIEVFFNIGNRELQEKTLIPSDMLFSFNDIKHQFKNCLEKWIEIEDLLKPVKNLYFGTSYNPRMYLEDKFLNLIQALETYHKRKFKESFSIKPEDYKKVLEKILEVIPSEYKNHFENKLEYAYESTLRTRIKGIIEHNSDIVKLFLTNNREKKSFINKVIQTRNYLTHYDEKLKEKAAKGEELYWLTQKLKILIEIVLMREIGLDSEVIVNSLTRNTEYQEIFIGKLKAKQKIH